MLGKYFDGNKVNCRHGQYARCIPKRRSIFGPNQNSYVYELECHCSFISFSVLKNRNNKRTKTMPSTSFGNKKTQTQINCKWFFSRCFAFISSRTWLWSHKVWSTGWYNWQRFYFKFTKTKSMKMLSNATHIDIFRMESIESFHFSI